MPEADQLTIIDSKTLRGVIAPAKVMSKEMLADLVDFLELSSVESVQETDGLLRDASKDSKWVSLGDVKGGIKEE
jgi:hypothetical protein